VGKEASIQFDGDRGFNFRVNRIEPWDTYPGWIWLTGYVLGGDGMAVESRTIWVQPDGLVEVQLDLQQFRNTPRRRERLRVGT
jgi:hypothetical protein